MKILSGELRGRNVLSRPDGSFRPTSDKIKQAIFNSLQGKLEGEHVLDLYAGTGAIALEALSNGAKTAYCVEVDKKRCRQIRETIDSIESPKLNCFVICQDASVAIRTLHAEKRTFHFIYFDPPYDDELRIKDIQFLVESGLLKEEGRLILETRGKRAFEYKKALHFIALQKERRYGNTVLLEYVIK